MIFNTAHLKLYVVPRRSVPCPGALCVGTRCCLALCASGLGALCFGLRTLCRAPALSVSPSVSGFRRPIARVGAGPQRSRTPPTRVPPVQQQHPARSACHPRSRALQQTPIVDLHHPAPTFAGCVPPVRFAGPQLRSACHPPGLRAPSSHPRANHPARRVPFFQEKPPNLAVWGQKICSRSYGF